MKKYYVTIPVAGSITVMVEADDDANEEQIEELAFDSQDWRIDSGTDTEPNDFEAMSCICRGNVCHAPVNELEIEEAE